MQNNIALKKAGKSLCGSPMERVFDGATQLGYITDKTSLSFWFAYRSADGKARHCQTKQIALDFVTGA